MTDAEFKKLRFNKACGLLKEVLDTELWASIDAFVQDPFVDEPNQCLLCDSKRNLTRAELATNTSVILIEKIIIA